MSIIIHVNNSSDGKGGELDEDIEEESILETAKKKDVNTSVNKPKSMKKNPNDLNRKDDISKRITQEKITINEEKNKEVKAYLKTNRKSDTDSGCFNDGKIDMSEIDNISYLINSVGKKINYDEINKVMNNQNFVYENYIKNQKEIENKVDHRQKTVMNNGFIENCTQQNTNNDSSQNNLKPGGNDKIVERNEKIKEINKKVEKIKTQNDKVVESVITQKTTKKEALSCFQKCGK